MVIQQRYIVILKRVSVLLLCLWAGGGVHVAAQSIITQHPEDVAVCIEEPVTFTVEVSGVNPVVYQWQKLNMNVTTHEQWDNVSYEGRAATYQITSAENNAGKYRCIVTVSGVTETSNPATLTINRVPSFSNLQNPILVPAVCVGSEIRATVNGTINDNGSPLTRYDWIFDGNPGGGGNNFLPGNAVPDYTRTAVNTDNTRSLRLTVSNDCGVSTIETLLVVRSTPLPPTVSSPLYYCKGATGKPLTIAEESNVATWYTAATGGTGTTTAPIPSTATPGVLQQWWVTQKVSYPGDYGSPICESPRSEIQVIVRALSNPPVSPDVTLCINDPDTTLGATGINVKWYNDMKALLNQAPTINTSEPDPQTYYITQMEVDKCESPIDDGKITVTIRNKANVEDIVLSYSEVLCPMSSTFIVVSSKQPYPTFRWYRNDNKTELFHTGTNIQTPVLLRDTAYYVTIEYANLCESTNPKSAMIRVVDLDLPVIEEPQSIVVSTNDGVCYATNVETGIPVATDNCTKIQANLKIYTEPLKPEQYELGDTTLMWWVEDEAGNRDYVLQAVSVRDREKPKPTSMPADVIRTINEDETSAIVFYDFAYTDNCGKVIDSLYRGEPSGAEFPLGETQIVYFMSDEAGNTDTCRFKVIVRHPPRSLDFSMRIPQTDICPGQEVVITPVVSGGSGRYDYKWQPRLWTEAVMRDYPQVNTTYELTVDDGTTTLTKSVQVRVRETRPVTLMLEGRPMEEIFEGDEVIVAATNGFDTYKLLLNNEIVQEAGLNNYVTFQAELGRYAVRVFATDENYCVTQDQLVIEVDSRKLPSVFTPNNDGKNEKFLEFLENSTVPEDFQLHVFSRSGELLYKGNGGWDGIYRGRLLPQGTYLYMVRRRMNNGEFRIFKGTVTLKL